MRMIFPKRAFGESMALPTSWFQTSCLLNCVRINFCCSTAPSLWWFVGRFRKLIQVSKLEPPLAGPHLLTGFFLFPRGLRIGPVFLFFQQHYHLLVSPSPRPSSSVVPNFPAPHFLADKLTVISLLSLIFSKYCGQGNHTSKNTREITRYIKPWIPWSLSCPSLSSVCN